MRSLLFRPDEKRRDELVAELWEGGTLGIIEEDDAIRAFFDDGHASHWAEAMEERHEAEAAFSTPESLDWDGVCAGERFFIAPPWVTTPPPDDRMRITFDAGSAFGTGRHETTQLMIEQLERIVRRGETVVDVGCGSGLLGQVSRLLGAGSVIGCDIDPLAVETAAANFKLPVFAGSADAIISASADILLVNISAKVIDVLAGELRRIAKPSSTVILAGFVSGNTPLSFRPRHVSERNNWLCWTGSRDDLTPGETLSVLTHTRDWW